MAVGRRGRGPLSPALCWWPLSPRPSRLRCAAVWVAETAAASARGGQPRPAARCGGGLRGRPPCRALGEGGGAGRCWSCRGGCGRGSLRQRGRKGLWRNGWRDVTAARVVRAGGPRGRFHRGACRRAWGGLPLFFCCFVFSLPTVAPLVLTFRGAARWPSRSRARRRVRWLPASHAG